MKRRHILATAAYLCAASAAHGAEFELSLGEIGLREYYCTAQMTLANRGERPALEVSGHFLLYVGDTQVGRSKGTWFMNLAPGESVTAVFETPNAPCTEVERYAFVVGACRLDGPGFAPVADCAARITGVGPVEVVPDP
ncbi:hypothetical protein Dshi_2022 [Dinoroseobacter shibae DFL 12 = DSM 16493]|jgi:hypothetical protein|uniref:Tat pathway signal sequence domain protein n=1 Tax=Dinoroseobacter shibae (strain DSM 16493 / NCIMB 14021 / DFL 12) TaxID=398580 RepID=A8LPQ7_DINSH|nr:hypothetical protein [Dinoroseobacter shibae]ABV93761.1 hypothetical protein Dshi_2022 [Dinoroseobacter shibae DFL 12 = DSM 16493]URF45213.1 hypothetical protein M8008_10465 [Dinoroseobacter shibae]URF49518.1 hypothetical protein M8007_10465 [Dinoroseobacter shibae]